jgi:hypothetical protein
MASEVEQFDAVAAAQAQAQAIAAKFEQQQAAGEGNGGGDEYGSNKRKFEDDPLTDNVGEDHMRKRTSFSGPEGGFNGVSSCLTSLVACMFWWPFEGLEVSCKRPRTQLPGFQDFARCIDPLCRNPSSSPTAHFTEAIGCHLTADAGYF